MSTIRANAIVDAAGGNTVTVNGALAVNETSLGTFAEGGAGRPRISGEAMARPGDGLSVLTVTAADTYTIAAGVGITVVSGALTNQTVTNVVGETITVNLFTGSIRLNASHAGPNGTSTLEVYKNNVLVTSFTTSSGSYVPRSVDISVVPTDVIEWRHRMTPAGQISSFLSGAKTASNAWVAQSVYRKAVP